MAEPTAGGFAEFYESVWGYEPFPWQAELTTQLMQEAPPSAIEAPTGLGKTSVISCWTYALAAQLSERRLPLRLFFVVDRRLIVDGAFEHARKVASALGEALGGNGVVAEVASRLKSRHQDPNEPVLEVVRMRGGVTWESRWLTRPDQPAVVCGTVDQFGSRLLFRGYGSSEKMRPIEAALVGTDSWLVVDEAHIAEPLAETVSRVLDYQKTAANTAFARPLNVTLMSATLGNEGDVLRVDADSQMKSDRFPMAAGVAARRLTASKPASLVEVSFLEKAPKGSWKKGSERLGQVLADLAQGLDSVKVIGVIANTISTARAAHQRLVDQGERAILLIGRVRGYERDEIMREWIPLIQVGAAPTSVIDRLFVVATQTIEVGADLDLDAIVSECAPLSSIIQRFGRVNRLGAKPPAISLIMHAAFTHDQDRIYGEATKATWDFLRSRSAAIEIGDSDKSFSHPHDGGLDFGLIAVKGLIAAAPDDVEPSAPFVPVMLGAHLERWATTNPAPWPDQPVGPFLHGVGRDIPEVSVAWRVAPPGGDDDPEVWQEWLDLAPPVEWEFVSVPIWEARALLANVPSDDPVSDVEGALEPAAGDELSNEPELSGDLLGVVYRGRKERPSLIRGPRDVSPGDRVVLRCEIGGHDFWGWTGLTRATEDPPVSDVGDLAPTRRRAVFRLSESVLSTLLPPDQIGSAFGGTESEGSDAAKEVLDALESLNLAPPLKELIEAARGMRPHPTSFKKDGHLPVWLLKGQWSRGALTAVSDDDPSSTSQTGKPVTLKAHCSRVGALAREFAEHVGLPDDLIGAIELAGRWHDLGKAEPRFQLMLHEGDELAALAAQEPLAKSGGDYRDPIAKRARWFAGLAYRFRHEAVSARIVDEIRRRAPELIDGLDHELLRHLVVSHHGKSRPLLPPINDPSAPDFQVTVDGVEMKISGDTRQVDWSQPSRFQALCEKYGWWGLALLEALVVLSDERVSATS